MMMMSGQHEHGWLLNALRDGSPTAAIIRLINQQTKLTLATPSHRSTFGSLPLHVAIQNRAPFCVIKRLIAIYPQAVHETRRYHHHDRLPIHMACYYDASYDVIKLLVECYEEGLHSKDEDGCLPIHFLGCSSLPTNETLRILELFLDLYPESALVPEYTNWETPLHQFCLNCQPVPAIDFLVRRCPRALQIRDRMGQLALHVSCKNDIRARVIRLLVDQYPGSVKEPDEEGSYPLHILCSNYVLSIPGIELVVQQYPEALEPRDGGGQLPFNIAWEASIPQFRSRMVAFLLPHHSNDVIKGEMRHCILRALDDPARVKMLIDKCPEGLRCTDMNGRLILHDALTAGGPVEVIELLCSAYPESLQVADNEGRLPLQCACLYTRASVAVLTLLLQRYPAAIASVDREGLGPLLSACKTDVSLDGVFTLLRKYPAELLRHRPGVPKPSSLKG